MNWFMIVTGAAQYLAAAYGTYTGQSWRINVMNACVATANIVLAGQR